MAAQICVVTGGSGYIASELVLQLLSKGYTVRATVRDPAASHKVEHLTKLGDALPGKLELHAADLLKEGSFDDAVRGADFVFHTASPYTFDVEDFERDLVEPALKGTKNVLASVAKSKDSVRRVVLTSSVVAVLDFMNPAKPKNGKVYTEEDWNDTSKADSGIGAYSLSKSLAEKEAWAWAKKEGVELVTIMPGGVSGPQISKRTDAESISLLKGWFEGNPFSSQFSWVDVRDVAKAHILAAETPSAHGRYLATWPNREPPSRIGEILQEAFPRYLLKDGEKKEPMLTWDNSKLRELGVDFIPVETSFIDMARALLALDAIKPQLKSQD